MTPKIANRPTLFSHPKIRCNLMNRTLCSNHLASSIVISVISSIVLSKKISQARGLQSNLPAAMQPVSSRRGPIILGFKYMRTCLEQFPHSVVRVMEYTGTPQLPCLSTSVLRSREINGCLPLCAHQHLLVIKLD